MNIFTIDKRGESLLSSDSKKILGETRRNLILKWLKEAKQPLKGGHLAKQTNVSRQVIVQDISLLKAKNEPIIATSQGYLYQNEPVKENKIQRVIACCHTPEQTQEELTLIVDYGVTIKDVIVEHPLYGEITASIMINSRNEVENFMKKLKETNATLLSELTNGIHLHTLEADTEVQLNQVCQALKEANFLIDEKEETIAKRKGS